MSSVHRELENRKVEKLTVRSREIDTYRDRWARIYRYTLRSKPAMILRCQNALLRYNVLARSELKSSSSFVYCSLSMHRKMKPPPLHWTESIEGDVLNFHYKVIKVEIFCRRHSPSRRSRSVSAASVN